MVLAGREAGVLGRRWLNGFGRGNAGRGVVPGEKAQAAIADSMFLLVIVASLAALMFLFASDYGVAIDRSAMDFYGGDYATSALQTVLYSSTPRHEGETLKNAKEIDYLLAFLKEDYANDREFSERTKRLLAADINTVMSSSLASHDFIFVMRTVPRHVGELSEFAFVLLKYAKYDPATGAVDMAYYSCAPGAGREHVIEEEFLSQAGRVIRAQPVILRFKVAEQDKTERIYTSLSMWPSVSLDETVIASGDDMNCTPMP